MYRTYLQILYGRTVGWVLTTGSTSPGSGGSRASPPPSPSPLAPLGTCSPCWFSYKSNAFYSLIFIIFLEILLTFVQVGSTLRHLFFLTLCSPSRDFILCVQYLAGRHFEDLHNDPAASLYRTLWLLCRFEPGTSASYSLVHCIHTWWATTWHECMNELN